MVYLIILLFAGSVPESASQGMWALRAGRTTEQAPIIAGASLYIRANSMFGTVFSEDDILEAIDGGDKSMVVPLSALLVSEGRTDLAEVFWELDGLGLPATRNDLLDALAWYGRYELYPVMARNPSIPSDMEGTMHADQCGAVCAMGWMTTRSDGLFHGNELVSPLDIQILSGFFPELNPALEYIPVDLLDFVFQTTGSGLR